MEVAAQVGDEIGHDVRAQGSMRGGAKRTRRAPPPGPGRPPKFSKRPRSLARAPELHCRTAPPRPGRQRARGAKAPRREHHPDRSGLVSTVDRCLSCGGCPGPSTRWSAGRQPPYDATAPRAPGPAASRAWRSDRSPPVSRREAPSTSPPCHAQEKRDCDVRVDHRFERLVSTATAPPRPPTGSARPPRGHRLAA